MNGDVIGAAAQALDRASSADSARTVAAPFGTFRHDVSAARSTWSDSLFRIYGFAPAEVVPSLDLMTSHQHPQDVSGWTEAVAQTLADGRSLCLLHRIVDGKLRARSLLSVGFAGFEADRVVELNGIVVDLTERLRDNQRAEITRAVQRSTESRSVIDQAKGVMMGVFQIDDNQAFELLRWHSSYANVKVRDVATILVGRLAAPELVDLPSRVRLATILTELATVEGKRALPTPQREETMLESAPDQSSRTIEAARLIPSAEISRTMLRAVAGAGQSITVADCLAPGMPLIYANAAFLDLTGYSADEVLGHNCRFLQGPDTDLIQVAEVRTAIEQGRELRTVLRNYRRDGSAFWNELHLSAVRDDAGRLTHFIGYQLDVSERVAREQQLTHLAYHDARTGLPNEAYAVRHIALSIEREGAQGLTVLHIRISGFRSAGDVDESATVNSVLATTRDRLVAELPKGAFLAKLDGDAFLVLLGPQVVLDVAAVSDRLDSPIVCAGDQRSVAVHIGQARYPVDGIEPAALIARARIAAAGSVVRPVTDRPPAEPTGRSTAR